ncbi:MAG: diacylglycerol kinase family protein [Bacteroidetes bacterium]|nr:diacylglycerol kinase family protein [Bacteroidota bacterium]
MKKQIVRTTAPFSLQARLKSFRYAWEGLSAFFSGQHNAILHAVATVVLVLLCMFVKPSATELMFLSVVTGLVWMAELINSAIEKLCDLVSPGYHPKIKYIKDVSAAAVLVCAAVAVIVALIIFIPKFL